MTPERCPHCHSEADVEISLESRFVCTVCGGVRIPIDDPEIARSAEQLDLLQRANVARSARATWRIMGAATAGFGVFSVLVLWLVISVAQPVFAGAVVAALAALVPFGFAAISFKRSQELGKELGPLVEKAWESAASDIARARGGKLDAPALAKITRTSEATADQVLSRMSTAKLLQRSGTSEGGHQYTLVEEPPKDNAAH